MKREFIRGEEQGLRIASAFVRNIAKVKFATHADGEARALRDIADDLETEAVKAEEKWRKIK